MVPTAYTRVIMPNVISIGSAVFVWVPNDMLYSALSVGKNTPKAAPTPWDFVTLPEEDRATAIGSMHRKIGKDPGDVVADRQTDTQTDVVILRHRSRGRSNNRFTAL